MCGIAGVVALASENGGDGGCAHRMISALRHRGPDELGVHAKGRVALAHARLSIVDLEGGRQPMETPDGQTVVVFNGEIFNHVELRAELEALGHVFQTRSDTEVLLRAYLEYGEDCVSRFNGQ